MLLSLYCHLATLKADYLDKLKNDRRGVSALEYALMGSLIAVVIVSAVSTLGTNASKVFTNIGNSLKAS